MTDANEVSPPCLDLLDGALARAAEGLFEAYGVEVRSFRQLVRGHSGSPCGELSGVIGFTSPELMGSLVLSMSDPALQMTIPSRDALGSDWIGELTNQLIGRVKNQLLKYGIALQLALPVVVRGHCLDRHDGVPLRLFEFQTDGGPILIRLAALAEGELQPRSSSELAPCLEEGELTFF